MEDEERIERAWERFADIRPAIKRAISKLVSEGQAKEAVRR